jgi:hypothetical protein
MCHQKLGIWREAGSRLILGVMITLPDAGKARPATTNK